MSYRHCCSSTVNLTVPYSPFDLQQVCRTQNSESFYLTELYFSFHVFSHRHTKQIFFILNEQIFVSPTRDQILNFNIMIYQATFVLSRPLISLSLLCTSHGRVHCMCGRVHSFQALSECHVYSFPSRTEQVGPYLHDTGIMRAMAQCLFSMSEI